jgi:putative transposase
MARIARVVAAGIPHHITQRGNRRQPTFFQADDYRVYRGLMAEWCRHWRVEVWAYCLMPNHVHLIAVPATEDGLRRAIGEAHRRYTRRVNFREGWRGHLWQGRFTSYPLDEPYLLAATRYVEQNPVKAGLAEHPWDYPWSSAAAHVTGEDDELVRVAPLCALVAPWTDFLATAPADAEVTLFRRHERSGRPLGRDPFVEAIEVQVDRPLQPGRPGRKRASPQQ